MLVRPLRRNISRIDFGCITMKRDLGGNLDYEIGVAAGVGQPDIPGTCSLIFSQRTLQLCGCGLIFFLYGQGQALVVAAKIKTLGMLEFRFILTRGFFLFTRTKGSCVNRISPVKFP
jgi:hypothetical protein